MKNADNPAMPTLTYDHGAAMQGLAVSVTDAPGLTKRELMAMHIACAMISAPIGKFNHASTGEVFDSAISDADLFFDKLERACHKT